MKRFAIIASVFCLLFTACTKTNENDSPKAGTISATIDGANVSFNTNAKAVRNDETGAYMIQVIGSQVTGGSSNQLTVAVTDESPIVAGTYNEMGTANGAGTVGYLQAGSAFPYVGNQSTSNPATITITEVNATSLKGTFSGDIYLMTSSGPSTTKKSITNGQFFVNF